MYTASIIGTGRIASSLEKDPLRPAGCTHAGTYNLHSDVRLIAGADIDNKALRAFGQDWKIPPEQLYTRYQDMLDQSPSDIVSICAYAPQRLEMAQAALESKTKKL